MAFWTGLIDLIDLIDLMADQVNYYYLGVA